MNEKTRTAINDVLNALDRIHDTLHTSPRPLRSALKLLDPLIIPPAQEPGDEGIDGEKAKRRGERAVAIDLLEQLRRLASQKEDESTKNKARHCCASSSTLVPWTPGTVMKIVTRSR